MEDLTGIFASKSSTIVYIHIYSVEIHETVNKAMKHVYSNLKKEGVDYEKDVGHFIKAYDVEAEGGSKKAIENVQKSNSSFMNYFKKTFSHAPKLKDEPLNLNKTLIDRTLLFQMSETSEETLKILDGKTPNRKVIDIYCNKSLYFAQGLLFYDNFNRIVPYFNYDIYTRVLSINDQIFKPTRVNAFLTHLKTTTIDILTCSKIWALMAREAVKEKNPTTPTFEWIQANTRVGHCELNYTDKDGIKQKRFLYVFAAPKRVFHSVFREV